MWRRWLSVSALLLLIPQLQAAQLERDVAVASNPAVQIHLIDAGGPSGKSSLLLIPGWCMTATIWREQTRVFAAERRVVALDPRSQGKSTKTAEGDTPEQRARDLHAVIEQLKLAPLVIVAWSQGVQDVAAYVQQFGTGGVKGIVLVDAVPAAGAAAIATAPADAVRLFGRLDAYTQDPLGYTRGFVRAIIQRSLTESEFGQLVAAAMKTPTAIGTAMLVADLYGADRTAAVSRFDRPTLVIAAAQSPELAAQQALAAALPAGRIEVIEHSGHAVFVDQPERFDALLRQFLQRLE
jgi:non-heme chloroperoxidase